MLENIDSKKIKSAVNRIHDALSRRFEKDLNLYVSKHQLEDIKQHLVKGELQAIRGLFQTKRLTADALTLTVLSNAWLLSSKTQMRDLDQCLSEIFKNCKPEILKSLSQKILNNQIQVPADLKLLMMQTHNQKSLSIQECQNLLNRADSNTKMDELEIWLKRVSEETKNPQTMYQLLNGLISRIPNLSNNANFFVRIVATDQLSDQDKSLLAEKIYQEQLDRKILAKQESPLWFNFFTKKLGSKKPIECVANRVLSTTDKEVLKTLTLLLMKVINANRDKTLEPWIIQQFQTIYRQNTESQYGLLLRLERLTSKELQNQLIQWVGNNIPSNNRRFIEKYNEVKTNIANGKTRDDEEFNSYQDIQAKLKGASESNVVGLAGYVMNILIKQDINQIKELIKDAIQSAIRSSNAIECTFVTTCLSFTFPKPELRQKSNKIQEFGLREILNTNISANHVLIQTLLVKFENTLKSQDIQDSRLKHTELKKFISHYDFNGLHQRLSLK